MKENGNFRILAYGEVLWDQLPSGDFIGGAPYNFAYRCHELGTESRIASRLGSDDLGRSAWDELGRLGVDRSLVQWDDCRPTGTVGISFDRDQVATIDVRENAAFDAIDSTPNLLDAAQTADCICFGTLIQRCPESRQTLATVLAHAPSALKVLDINLRTGCYTPEIISWSLAAANLLKLNRQEVDFMSALYDLPRSSLREFAESALRRWSLDAVVVTLEDYGAFAASSTGEAVYSPGFAVRLADPLGAGDAFTAGFVTSRIRGASLTDSCLLGNALGALVASRDGATASIGQSDIDAILRSPDRRVDSSVELLASQEVQRTCRS